MTGNLEHDLARRLERAFADDPPHGPAFEDLQRGRRALRRRRVGVGVSSLAALSAVVVLAGVVHGLPGDRAGGKEALPAASAPDDAQIVESCLATRHVTDSTYGRSPSAAKVRRELAGAELMTSSSSRYETVATLRSGDGARYADCHLGRLPGAGFTTYVSIYPASVHLEPRRSSDGLPVYDPPAENTPGRTGTAAQTEPQVWVPCAASAPEETAAYYRQLAGCGRFTVTWNDRRVPDVARARIVTPDGEVRWADVREGYLSFTYVGTMTDEVAEQIRDFRPSRSNPWPEVREVTFYDEAGHVLVRDTGEDVTDPDPSRLSIRNYPSLAWWTDEEQ